MTVHSSRPRQRRLLVIWLVVLAGTALSVGTGWWLHCEEEDRIHQEFISRTHSLVNIVQQVLVSREEALLNLRDLYHHSSDVTRDEFALAAGDLIERKPGLIALLWAPRVTPAQRQLFETEANTAETTGYKIHHLAKGQRIPPPENAETFPIARIAPTGMFQVEGLDLISLPVWPVLQESITTGQIRFSEPPGALIRDAHKPTCLLAIPVYHNTVPRVEAERTAQLRGFVIGLFDPTVLLDLTTGRLPNQDLEVLLVERHKSGNIRPLHHLPAVGTAPMPNAFSVDETKYDLHYKIASEFGDGDWELWARPGPAWTSGQRTFHKYITGCFGLLFTGLLATYLLSLFRKTDAIEVIVAQRTAELTNAQNQLRDDISQRTKTEQSLKASEERYRILISQSADAIWLLELLPPVPVHLPLESQLEQLLTNARIAECNNPAAQIYGHKQPSSILGRDLAYFAPHSHQRHETVLRAFLQNSHHLAEHEAWDNSPGGETRVFQHNLIGLIEDDQLVRIWITERELTHHRQLEQERQTLERQLSETQRLESLGVLAGGIAHDFNNLLTSILGHASLGRAEIPPDSPLDVHFAEIETASRNAANLCQQMLAYAGKGRFVVKPQNLSQLVTQTAQLLQTTISRHCVLNFQLEEGLPLVMADAIQIQQILTNLVLNASEAIGTRGGQINVSTGLIHPDASTFLGCPYAPAHPAAAYVYLTVQDNGPGMDTVTTSRIFEPFFTTKFTGRGLGLPATLGIVRSHQGALRVESQPSQGASFTLFLPVVDPNPSANKPETNTPWEAEGTLLIIDDEASVRGVAERMARSLGFSALSAPDGDHGVELFRHYQPNITAVLVDLSMLGLSGEETMQKLRAQSPTVRLIAMSGYNAPATLAVPGVQPVFLAKPFNITQFQSVIRQATKKTPIIQQGMAVATA